MRYDRTGTGGIRPLSGTGAWGSPAARERGRGGQSLGHAHPLYRLGRDPHAYWAGIPVPAIPDAYDRRAAVLPGLPVAAAVRRGVPRGMGAGPCRTGLAGSVSRPFGHAAPAGGIVRRRPWPCAYGGGDRTALRAAGGPPARVRAGRRRTRGRPAPLGGCLAAHVRCAGAVAAVAQLAGGDSDARCVCCDCQSHVPHQRRAGRRGLLPDRCAGAGERQALRLVLCCTVRGVGGGRQPVGQPSPAGRAAAAHA